MLNITFKNVGQGDSIILEWGSKKVKSIGIIDCNLFEGNPVLEYLKTGNIKSIDFIILSHPHSDHFSGMLEVFEHCLKEDVKIKYFICTCHFSPDYIKAAMKTRLGEKSLGQLFRFINTNHLHMGIKVGFMRSDEIINQIPLGEIGTLTFLSPTYGDALKFIKSQNYKVNEEGSSNNPNANILSTICRLDIKSGYILLTSDVTKKQLDRIIKELDGKLILGQSPHHGASSNHSSNFWHNIKRDSKTPIVFSVGPNGYKHPSSKAIMSFEKNDYVIHITNSTNSTNVSSRSQMLDVFAKKKSKAMADSRLHGDQIFSFEA